MPKRCSFNEDEDGSDYSHGKKKGGGGRRGHVSKAESGRRPIYNICVLFVTDESVSHRSNIWGRRWKSRTYKDANCQKAKNTGYGKEGP